MYARAPATLFLPHNSAASHSLVAVNMQMDAYLKKEQIGTLFVQVGHWKGGLGGGWSLKEVQPKNLTCLPKKKNSLLAVR